MKRIVLGGLAAVMLSATPAWAQRAPGVVDGDHWMNSSAETRKAFLLGAGNMVALESAYSKKKGTPPPPVGTMTVKAVQGMSLDQIEDRITRWYEANPTRRATPVMAVIWLDIVNKGAAAR